MKKLLAVLLCLGLCGCAIHETPEEVAYDQAVALKTQDFYQQQALQRQQQQQQQYQQNQPRNCQTYCQPNGPDGQSSCSTQCN